MFGVEVDSSLDSCFDILAPFLWGIDPSLIAAGLALTLRPRA